MSFDMFKYAFKNLIMRPTRSFLTMLSILIGVMAIFAIVSFGLGLQNYIDVIAEEAGTDKLFIQSKGVGAPGTDDTFSITQSDLDFVDRIKGVEESAAMYAKVFEIKKKKEIRYAFGMSFEDDTIDFVEESFMFDVEKGRRVQDGELSRVCLGYLYQIPDKIFEKPVSLGDKIEINGESFEVVCFYSEIGNPSDDSNIYFSKDAFENLLPEVKNKFAFAMLRADPNVDTEELADKIEEKLRKHKDQEEGKETFYVQSFADMLEMFGQVVNIINGILYLIALISIVVASVNIMNTMYTAVFERRKEIGIMKAIGAKNNSVLTIFIIESALLGLLGGMIGIGLGYTLSSTLGLIISTTSFKLLQPVFPLYLFLGCAAFATVVGIIAGVLPAIQASQQNPVDALRSDE